MEKIMKCRRCLFVVLLVMSGVDRASAQGTAFTYQGSLNADGTPANGLFDFEFSLYPNAEASGVKVGSTITETGIGVTNGLFTVTLDFGAVFTGNDTWLAISVRSNGVGSYTGLMPLQELTPTPYAVFANTSSNVSGTVAAGQLSGIVPLAQLPGALVTNNEAGVALVSLTLSSNLTLPSPATVDSGGSSLLRVDANNNFYAGPGAGSLSNTGGANTGIGYQSLQNAANGNNNTAIGYQSLNNDTNGSDNTASGERALFANTSGNDNTADGRHALFSDTNGNDNTASGYEALSLSTGGSNNIALGYQAGNNFAGNESSNIDIGNPGVSGDNKTIRIGSGETNTFIAGVINGDGGGLTNLIAAHLSGAVSLAQLPSAVVTNNETNITLGNLTLGGNLTLPLPGTIYSEGVSLFYNDGNGNFFAGFQAGNPGTSGSYNSATGSSALSLDESGSYNTANGHSALSENTTGGANTAVGNFALYDNTSGSQNVAIGASALENSKTDSSLVAVGDQALQNDNASGKGYFSQTGENTAIGYQALQADAVGAGNSGLGYQALQENKSGDLNTAIGDHALQTNMSGTASTAVGAAALANAIGSDNTALGISAGLDVTNGEHNIYIRNLGVDGDTGTIRIGEPTLQTGNTLIAGIWGTVLPADGMAVYVGPDGHLGTTVGNNSYTPTIGDGTHNFATTTQMGYYTKAGNLVYFEIWLQWSAGRGSATSGDDLQISLPPGLSVVSQRVAFPMGFTSGITFGNQLTAGAYNGQSDLQLYSLSNSGGTASVVTVSDCSTSGELQISGSYRWQ
jgi:hypothetical protein